MEAQTDLSLEQLTVSGGGDAGADHSVTSEWVSKAQQAMIAICVFSVVLLVYSWSIGIFRLASVDGFIKKEEKKLAQNGSIVSNSGNSLNTNIPDVGLQNRSLFSWDSGSGPGDAAVMASSPGSVYRLVGISAGVSAQDSVAMIENTKTKMTLVLPFGKNVEGLELKSIQNGKVVVKIGGVEIELE